MPKFASIRSSLGASFGIEKDTSNSMIPVPLLNPKFATVTAEKSCELRVRGTGSLPASRQGYSASDFSTPSPTAKRTKPVTLIGPPTLPSASLRAWATDFLSSWM